MDPKDYLIKREFCPVPWTGIMYNHNGDIKTCIRSNAVIGNLCDDNLETIITDFTDIKNQMLIGEFPKQCSPCHELEITKSNGFDIISDRVFYLKNLRTIDRALYDDPNNFELASIDVRWSNLCNFACIYCSKDFSSKWADELKIYDKKPPAARIDSLKSYILKNIENLKQVYLAGGEPLLMKENSEILDALYSKNPNVYLRVNTNLSKVDTSIFEKICKFKNVHWTISVETIEDEFEYIRYGSKWQDFVENLDIISKLQHHKVSFNMLYFALNSLSIFDCLKFLKSKKFHNNSFIIGALLSPDKLNVRHLPDGMLYQAKQQILKFLENNSDFLLGNGLTNILTYLDKPIDKDIGKVVNYLKELDARRGINSQLVFKDFYQQIMEGN